MANEKKLVVATTSNNKSVKFQINQSEGCIDRQRNKLRNDLVKTLTSKEIMVKGQKFGSVVIPNQQQVSGLMRTMTPIIKAYVEENTTDYDRKELWGLQNEATQTVLGTQEAITNELIIKQHQEYFKNTLTKKVKG